MPVLRYRGPFTDRVVSCLSDLLDSALEEFSWTVGQRTRLKSLVVEQAQNIQRYSNDQGFGWLLLGVSDQLLFIETGNRIDEKFRSVLKAALEDIRALGPEELRIRYKEVMSLPLEGQGAGLGLLSLAKRSHQPLDYGFRPRTDDYFDFWVRSYINFQEIPG